MIAGSQTNYWRNDNGATPRLAAQLLFITLWDLRNSITYKDTKQTSFYMGQANRVLALYLDLLDVSLLV